MAVKVKKNKRPKISQKQSVRQTQKVSIHLGTPRAPRRRTGLQKAKPMQPQPHFSIVTNVAPNDTSLLYRELFSLRNAIKGPTNPFEKAVAAQVAETDRALQTTQLEAAAAVPERERIEKPREKPKAPPLFLKPRPRSDITRTMSEPTGLEPTPMRTLSLPARFGADAPLSFIGARTNLQDAGPMGISRDARPTPEMLLAERMMSQQHTEQFLREKAILDAAITFEPTVVFPAAASTAPSTIRDVVGESYGLPPMVRASSGSSTISDITDPGSPFQSPPLSAPLVVPPLSVISTSMEAPNRKADSQSLGATPLPEPRILAESITAPIAITAAKREPALYEPSVAITGETTKPDFTVSLISMSDETAPLIKAAQYEQGHGLQGALQAKEKQPTGEFTKAGRPKKSPEEQRAINAKRAATIAERKMLQAAIDKGASAASVSSGSSSSAQAPSDSSEDMPIGELIQRVKVRPAPAPKLTKAEVNAKKQEAFLQKHKADTQRLTELRKLTTAELQSKVSSSTLNTDLEQQILDERRAAYFRKNPTHTERDYIMMSDMKDYKKSRMPSPFPVFATALGGAGGLSARLAEQRREFTPTPTPRQIAKADAQRRSQVLQEAGLQGTLGVNF